MKEVTGSLIIRVDPFRVPKEKTPVPEQVILDLEQWLNGEVAQQAYEKFGVGIRVHLTLKD